MNISKPTKIIWISCVIIYVLSLSFFFTNDYMSSKEYVGYVEDKLQVAGRRSGKLYLIIKWNDGIITDEAVTPVEYSQAKIGEPIKLKVKPFHRDPTMTQTFVYFILPCVVAFLACIGFILPVVIFKGKFRECN